MIVVAPECSNGFYCDMAYGDAWYTYVTEELPAEDQPKLFFTCGTEDKRPYSILSQNRSLHAYMKDLPLQNYRYMEWVGNHEWKFWDRSLVYAIDWFLSPGYAQKKLGDWRSEARIVTEQTARR